MIFFAADRAIRIGGNTVGTPLHLQRIPGQQFAGIVAPAEQEFECDQCLEAADGSTDRPAYAGLLAGLREFAGGGVPAAVDSYAAGHIENGELAPDIERLTRQTQHAP